jgi:guanylate kinase
MSDLPKQYPLLIVIAGPSGVGKDSVLNSLKNQNLDLHFVVTATNRAARSGEVDGVDYIFVSTDEFIHMIEADELIEYAQVYNDYKGVPKSQLQDAFDSGKDVIMRVDVQGAATLRQKYPQAMLIYLSASEEDLLSRLQERGTDDDDSRRLRVAMARKEIETLPEFDYMVENAQGRLDETVQAIISIIRAEHFRVNHRQVTL